ncbi:Trp biosynthesis-associated membrane protein [Arthrobacter sp. I2-34]|uniref:Trp biosynthesis-associated membrane protein n=1 Tax=Arthrobacter hankyongi TaxID=2904801 RepID=A0ABS9LC33_9MICC|nr:Trp biosynthesis-associated membrane protein [Arthrobacter hankyongi]MCG2624078.1 Trp biosynthesis-associated membrane protein [Arthrobacter hankyongi]
MNTTRALAPAWQRKATVVLASALVSLGAFATTTQTWLHVQLPQGGVQTPDLSVAGSDAATAVTALALVGVAAALAASIAGRVARVVTALLLGLAGAGIAWTCLRILAEPAAAASGAIGKATGMIGGAASITLTPWPALAAVAGVLMVLCAVWIVAAGRRWPATRKYGAAAKARAQGRQADGSPADRSGPVDEIDSWDQLSRGNDPTD